MYNLKLTEMLTWRIGVYVHFCKCNSENGKESAKNKWVISEVADKIIDKQHPTQRRWAGAKKWSKQHKIFDLIWFFYRTFKLIYTKQGLSTVIEIKPGESTGAAWVSAYTFCRFRQSNFASTFLFPSVRSFDMGPVCCFFELFSICLSCLWGWDGGSRLGWPPTLAFQSTYQPVHRSRIWMDEHGIGIGSCLSSTVVWTAYLENILTQIFL